MKLKNEFEIYSNRKLIKVCKGWKSFEKYIDNYLAKLRKNGYSILRESMGNYYVLVNYKKQDCIFLAHRQWIGLYDCKGNKIYHDDVLRNKEGYSVDIIPAYSMCKHNQYRINERWVSDCVIFNDTDFIKEEGIKVTKSVFETF